MAGGMDQFLVLPQDPLGPEDKHQPLMGREDSFTVEDTVVPAPETAKANAFVSLLPVVVKSFSI